MRIYATRQTPWNFNAGSCAGRKNTAGWGYETDEFRIKIYDDSKKVRVWYILKNMRKG